MKWTGEQVGDYASEIRRLAALAGVSGGAMERMVRLAFVTGFPDDISISLQQLPSICTMLVSELIERIHAMGQNDRRGVVCTVTETKTTNEANKATDEGKMFQLSWSSYGQKLHGTQTGSGMLPV